ncbi:hypothetical protein M501DRAFT_993850 [Patellaria atrata CBS 101060]|uniref:Secreted protein n=1 Tax=Patellaria atrata CBS 101060 TaxID=1346257 RepID=A0A9P4VWS7_9PEZI|nr:hypothetical protein M501DRAFT_993850 [Patellaria atrata CBS 101060]
MSVICSLLVYSVSSFFILIHSLCVDRNPFLSVAPASNGNARRAVKILEILPMRSKKDWEERVLFGRQALYRSFGPTHRSHGADLTTISHSF